MKKEKVFRDPEIDQMGRRLNAILYELNHEVDFIAFPDDYGNFQTSHTYHNKERLIDIENRLLSIFVDIYKERGENKTVDGLKQEFDEQVDELGY